MEFFDVVKKRRSYRFYKTEMPEDDKINRILEAARLAPTWANRQGMHYIIVNDKKLIKAVWEAIGQKQKFIDSPIFIVGLIAESGSGANRTEKYYPIDFGICFEHLILAATAEGLGTCWIGLFDEIRIKEILGIPTKYRVLGITPLGYPVKQKGEIKDRKPLKDFIHYNNF